MTQRSESIVETFWDQVIGRNLVSNGDAESGKYIVPCNGSKIDPIIKWHRRNGIEFSVIDAHIGTFDVKTLSKCCFFLISFML